MKAVSRPRTRLVLAAAVVAAALIADGCGWLPARASVILDDSAQFVAGSLAAICCAVTARHRQGVERAWRQLIAIGMGGWSVGQLIWSWYQIFAKTPLPSPSIADIGYLIMPVFASAALCRVAVDRTGERRRTGVDRSAVRTRLVLVLDGLIVVGSLLILTWATTLGAVVRAGAPTAAAFAVAIAYPVTDVMLVVMVTLLLATGSVAPYLRPQLALLGLGLVGLSASDSVFAYLVASAAPDMPPATNAGFVAGPVLIVLAALTPGTATRPEWSHPRQRAAGPGRLFLPYVPLVVTGTFLIARKATGGELAAVEFYVGMLVVILVVVRQLITLVDNSALLERVSETQRELRYQATHDPLSGLPNRTLFRRCLVEAIERGRSGTPRLTLFFIDLDDFKVINDSLGHEAGDRVLRAVGDRLRECVHARDIVGRLGGDEFGVLVEGERCSPDRIGERLIEALREPFDVDGRPFLVGASVGAASVERDEPALTADVLLRRADAAMYAGKRRGKGRFVRYGRSVGDGVDDTALPTRMAEALAGDPEAHGLSVHYQPIVRMPDGHRVAVEALARWHHPLLGPVPATVFVPMAERTGLVRRLDEFVLDRACRDLSEYLRTSGDTDPDITVHVNISASRLGDPEVEAAASACLARHGLAARHLVLEVTESSPIADLDAAVRSAWRLRGSGLRLALDDFGTGYSTLSLLHELPLDIIKLDRSLTGLAVPSGVDGRGLVIDDRSEALCRAVVAIADGLGIMVVAEGVETAEQEAMLSRAGCRHAQGHRYGRPGPFRETFPGGTLVDARSTLDRGITVGGAADG